MQLCVQVRSFWSVALRPSHRTVATMLRSYPSSGNLRQDNLLWENLFWDYRIQEVL